MQEANIKCQALIFFYIRYTYTTYTTYQIQYLGYLGYKSLPYSTHTILTPSIIILLNSTGKLTIQIRHSTHSSSYLLRHFSYQIMFCMLCSRKIMTALKESYRTEKKNPLDEQDRTNQARQKIPCNLAMIMGCKLSRLRGHKSKMRG